MSVGSSGASRLGPLAGLAGFSGGSVVVVVVSGEVPSFPFFPFLRAQLPGVELNRFSGGDWGIGSRLRTCRNGGEDNLFPLDLLVWSGEGLQCH